MGPTTSRDYRAVKETIHRRLRERLDVGRITQLSKEAVRIQVAQIVENLVTFERTPINLQERERLSNEVLDDVFGLGPLEQLLRDPSISDILVNSHDEVYIERRGRLERSPVQFRDDAHLIFIISRIVSGVGRRVDESSPIVDARLPDGSRANAIIPPLAIDGPCLSIRRFGREMLSSDDLIQNHTLTAPMLEFLRACVYSRLNIIVSGGPGSGKTTLLNILSSFISSRERIVTIEDSTELQLRQDHVVRLETRPPNIEGSGGIPARRLVINALRMRPDRIIVGEVRGEEAVDMLQAMNTGHDGSLTTIHARAGYDAISRLETMVATAGLDIPVPVLRAQIASAINLVVQVSRLTDGTRKVVNISEIVGMEGEAVILQEIFVFDKSGIGEDDAVLGEFVPTGRRPKCLERLAAAGVTLPLSMFDPKEIQVYNEVVEQIGNASDLSSREGVAAALASKATALIALNRTDEEIETYDSIAERFGGAAELSLREQVARALVNKGIALDRVGCREEAIQAYDLVAKRFGEATEASLRHEVARALVSKGIVLGKLNRRQEAIADYDLVLKRFGWSSEVAVLDQVARALVNKGVALARLNRREEAVQAYDMVIKRFDTATELTFQEQVARALVSKGAALCRLNRSEEAIQAYDSVVERFGRASEQSLQEEVRGALDGKAVELRMLGRSEEEIEAYNDVVEQLQQRNRACSGGTGSDRAAPRAGGA